LLSKQNLKENQLKVTAKYNPGLSWQTREISDKFIIE